MNLVAMEIPDDPVDWPKWLERELVGVRLRELIGELRVFAGKDSGAPPTLSQLLGEQSDAVCEKGLAALNQDQLIALFKHPEKLLDLQEWVFIHGGAHWQKIESSSKSSEASQRVWQGIQAQLTNRATLPPAEPSVTSVNTHRPAWMTRAVGAVVMLAASILVAAWLGVFSPSNEKWGWLKEDTFAAQVKNKDFLSLIADRAGEWSTRPRDTKPALRSSLADFRRMCDRLQNAPLTQLSKQTDRDWVKERCAAWAKKIDGHLADLDSGKKSVETVLKESNSTIEALREALMKRAAEFEA